MQSRAGRPSSPQPSPPSKEERGEFPFRKWWQEAPSLSYCSIIRLQSLRKLSNPPSKAYKLMAEACFHPSVEGAQHGAKNLADFLAYAKKSGAAGAQPSNYMLQADKGFKSAKEIKQTFEKAKMKLDGVSGHCRSGSHHRLDRQPLHPPIYSRRSRAQTAGTNRKMGRGLFARPDGPVRRTRGEGAAHVLGCRFRLELALGYPWGFWKGGDYDLSRKARNVS